MGIEGLFPILPVTPWSESVFNGTAVMVVALRFGALGIWLWLLLSLCKVYCHHNQFGILNFEHLTTYTSIGYHQIG
jgi:hypothetical protein